MKSALIVAAGPKSFMAGEGIRLARAHRTSPGACLVAWAIIGLIVLALAACSTATPAAQEVCDYRGVLAYAQRGDPQAPWPCAGKVLDRGADLSGLSNSTAGGATAGDRATVPVEAQ